MTRTRSSRTILGLNSWYFNLQDRMQKILVTSLVWIFLWTLNCDYCVGNSSNGGNVGAGGRGLAPEFADLLKNSSVGEGSHVDFSCNIRHLGGNRIMWLKKEDDKEVLLGINTLKITKNPRITLSIIPSSGEVTTSILYINNVDKEDDGTYHCIVNSSPMILQVGILEVKDPVVHPVTPSPTRSPIVDVEQHPHAIKTTSKLPENTHHRPYKYNSTNNPQVPTQTLEMKPATTGTGRHNHDSHCDPVPCEKAVSSQNPDSNNMFCVDIDKIWTQTRDGAQYLFSWFFTCFQTIF